MIQPRVTAIILWVSFLWLATVWGVPAAAGERIVLRCADNQKPGYPTIEGVLEMARRVKEHTNGRIEVKVYPEGSLGTEKSVVEMLQLGALDLGRVSVTQVAEVSPEIGVFVLPYIFKNNDHKWKVLEGPIGNNLLKGLAKVNLIGLCFQESGYRSFYNTRRPIYKPSDLKGLKIRVQPSQIMSKLVECFGASAVPIDYQEVYAALAAGVIDGAENNIPSFVTTKHYQVARYYSFDRHSSIPEVVVISKSTWSKLKPVDREILMAAARESVIYQRELWAKYEDNCLRQLEREGCQFNEVEIEAFKKVSQSFYQKYANQYQATIAAIKEVN